jgi:hypothetical protein
MNSFLHILLFLIILFIYLHVSQQHKISEDLEIYEMDYTSLPHLNEVCDLKQPVMFYYKDCNPRFFDALDYDRIDTYKSHDLRVLDIRDYWNDIVNIDYAVLTLSSMRALTDTDKNACYFTEGNQLFIEDTGLTKAFRENDEFLCPALVLQPSYDIMFGSPNSITPLRYHTHHRHFICVVSGKIRIQITPWKSSKHLHPYKDLDMYEFRSPINVWKPQRKYFTEMDKLKFLEFDVPAGNIVYIPAYWWYSIQYSEEPDTIVASFTYNNIANTIANSSNLFLYLLQQSSTTFQPVNSKKIIAESEAPIDMSLNEISTEDQA